MQLKRGAGRGIHASRLAVKYNRDLDGKTSLARNLRALRNFNITDRFLETYIYRTGATTRDT